MNILKNYIGSSKEWDFNNVSVEYLLSILTNEQKNDDKEYFLFADDNLVVYFLVQLNKDEDEEDTEMYFMGNYGTTTTFQWNNNTWEIV